MGIDAAAGVYGLEQRPRVARGALKRVIPRLLSPVEERPVARLKREELARRALRGLPLQLAGADRLDEPELEPLRSPGHVAHLRGVPGAKVLALAPGGLAERPRLGFVALQSRRQRDQAHSVCLRAREHP